MLAAFYQSLKYIKMGRELRRVPINFKYEIGQLWKGYINPYSSLKCKSCDGSGMNKATKLLSDNWYSHLREDGKKGWSDELTEIEIEELVKYGRLNDLMPNRCCFDKDLNKWIAIINGEQKEIEKPEMPTPEKVNSWSKKGMGHDSINHYICTKIRAKHLGFYGNCEFCDGEGEIWQSEAIKKMHDEWESFEPPTGEGFQLWNTTTEGHPLTPVFETLDLLCEYLEMNNISLFGDNTATKEQWKKMLDANHVYYSEGNLIFI